MSRQASPRTITPDLLLRAYAAGIFPMAEHADDPDLFWVDPERRGILPLDGLLISRSLRKVVKANRFAVTLDGDFGAVIDGCAEAAPGRAQTWINTTIRELYGTLFERGAAHTVEARREGKLVGGLYGISIGGAFFGESMFHRETDASKVCLVHLAAHLIGRGFVLLDAQFVTPHLATLGAVEISRARYQALLTRATALPVRFGAGIGETTVTGERALAIIDARQARP